jgi:probable F420-dependent oxidoreductase
VGESPGRPSLPRVGIVFPHAEVGTDPAAIRDFVQAADALGYSHIHIYDHVLGGDPSEVEPGRYSVLSPFHEPLVLGGFIAAATSRIGIVTGVLVLPQRQAALVAKQAAEVDILSGGRLVLGVGTGWNQLEYEALGTDFASRGARLEEQVGVLRRLWTGDRVRFVGRFHNLNGAGINPRPIRSIPVWFGGEAERVLDRAARIGDGWFPLSAPTDELASTIERLHKGLVEVGRNPAEFAICGYANYENGDADRWHRQRQRWGQAGATHISLRTTPPVLSEPRQGIGAAYHLGALETYARAVLA